MSRPYCPAANPQHQTTDQPIRLARHFITHCAASLSSSLSLTFLLRFPLPALFSIFFFFFANLYLSSSCASPLMFLVWPLLAAAPNRFGLHIGRSKGWKLKLRRSGTDWKRRHAWQQKLLLLLKGQSYSHCSGSSQLMLLSRK